MESSFSKQFAIKSNTKLNQSDVYSNTSFDLVMKEAQDLAYKVSELLPLSD